MHDRFGVGWDVRAPGRDEPGDAQISPQEYLSKDGNQLACRGRALRDAEPTRLNAPPPGQALGAGGTCGSCHGSPDFDVEPLGYRCDPMMGGASASGSRQ